jgi:hypothetical protein
MSITVPGFPNSFQTEYARIPKAPLPGDLWESELFNERPFGGLIAAVTPVAYAATVTIAAFNSGDEVGVVINGVTIPVTAVTDADATAALLNTAINNATLLSGVISSTVAGAVLTLAGALGVEITVTEYSPDATTAAVTGVTAAVIQQQLDFGYGVVRDIPSLTVNRNAIKKPTAASDKFVGVLVRTRGGQIPAAQIEASGFDPDWLLPGNTYAVLRENAGVVVEFVGDAPTESDDVYLIFSGANAGKWRATDGGTAGTSEIVTLTLTTTAADALAFNFDGLPDLAIASASGTEATDAAAFFALWVANAAYAAIGSIVDNADGTLTITFFDDTTHAFTDNSGGASTITEAVDTAAVAAIPATAMLIANYSWGLPSIEAAADLPARAFLRLSPS